MTHLNGQPPGHRLVILSDGLNLIKSLDSACFDSAKVRDGFNVQFSWKPSFLGMDVFLERLREGLLCSYME